MKRRFPPVAFRLLVYPSLSNAEKLPMLKAQEQSLR